MKRERYLLDTCTLIWLLQGNKRVKSFWEKNKDYNNDWMVSVDSLKEILHKKAINKLDIKLSYKQIVQAMEDENLQICSFEKMDLDALSSLPYFDKHKDPNDRNIIATAIARKRVIVTGDTRFELYEKHGLQLLQI
jgi:PIN domain nuclease of toxin-antitoxin system